MNEITQLLHIDPLLLQALREDIPEEDVSTNAVMPHACPGTVDLIAKEDGIVAGLAVYARVFTLLDPGATVEFFCRDGDTVQPGQKLAVVTGDIRALLSGERVALNYLQRMSGIATYTHQLSALLESLVFAQRAADDILYGEPPVFTGDKPDLAPYREQEPLFAAYRQEVLTAIERSKNHE